jgi:hypothetical protein
MQAATSPEETEEDKGERERSVSKELARIVRIFEEADREFSQSLLLVLERMILHRLTTARRKNQELSLIVQAIKEIVSSSQNSSKKAMLNLTEHISSLDFLGTDDDENRDGPQDKKAGVLLANAFRQLVDVVEKLDTEDMYSLISRLRKEPLRRKYARNPFSDF